MIFDAVGLPVAAGYTPDNPIIGYENLAAFDNITASSEDADFPATNLANPSTGLKWKASSTSACTIVFNVAAAVDYVGIAAHNFGTAGVTVEIKGRNGASPFTSILGPKTPPDDAPLIFRFPQVTYDDFEISLGAGSAAAEAAIVYVGKILTLQRRVYVGHEPITYARDVTFAAAMSDGGVFLGKTVLGEKRSTRVSLQHLTPEWVRNWLDPFLVAAQTKPFFWGWRPSTYPAETGFCWFPPGTAPRPSNQLANGMMQISWDMDGIA